ncbi:MAG TPA: MlaD family protein [Pseudonocardia sp.]|jgi:phospholipid/cholesterol/gamma-HCH transport system substrate-binding protein|nr:MlaD family protein [Pseudonocardia sp.]
MSAPLPGSSGVRKLASGVAVVLVLVVAGWLTMRVLDTDSPVSVTAVFADSSPLVAGNKVQLAGVQVGTISSIELVDGTAHVHLSLDRAVLPLHTDATAQIQPVSLLGERFIALNQGTASAPALAEPLVIDARHTSSSVDLDQLIGTLNDPTSTALAAMVTTLGESMAGQGDRVAESLHALTPTLRQADQLSRLLDQQNVVLRDLVVSAQRNATAFDAPLDSLVGSAQQTLGAVAANRAGMDGALVALPGTLAAARRTLNQLGGAADHVGDVLAGARPLTHDLVHTSRELHEFADAADPAFDSLPHVLRRVNHMLDDARPVVRDLRPAASGLRDVSSSVGTLSRQLFTHEPGVPSALENVMTGAANWAMATSGYDGLSHYFRAVVTVMPTNLFNSGAGTLPPLGRQNPFNPVPRNPNGPDVHGPRRLPLPMMPTLPNADGPDNGSYSVAPGAPRTTPARGGTPSATGLTRAQEGDMVDQLLGGGN